MAGMRKVLSFPNTAVLSKDSHNRFADRKVKSLVLIYNHSEHELLWTDPAGQESNEQFAETVNETCRHVVSFQLGCDDNVNVSKALREEHQLVKSIKTMDVSVKKSLESSCMVLNNPITEDNFMSFESQKYHGTPHSKVIGISKTSDDLNMEHMTVVKAKADDGRFPNLKQTTCDDMKDANHSTLESSNTNPNPFHTKSKIKDCIARPWPLKELKAQERELDQFSCKAMMPANPNTDRTSLPDSSILAPDDHHLLSRVSHLDHVIGHVFRRANSIKVRGKGRIGMSQKEEKERHVNDHKVKFFDDEEVEENLDDEDDVQFFPHSFADKSCLSKGESFLSKHFPRIYHSKHSTHSNNKEHDNHHSYKPHCVDDSSNSNLSSRHHHSHYKHYSHHSHHSHHGHHSLREYVLEVLHAPHRFRRTRRGFTQLTIG